MLSVPGIKQKYTSIMKSSGKKVYGFVLEIVCKVHGNTACEKRLGNILLRKDALEKRSNLLL